MEPEIDFYELINKAQLKANKINKTIYVIEDYVDGYYFCSDDDFFDRKDIFFAVFPKSAG